MTGRGWRGGRGGRGGRNTPSLLLLWLLASTWIGTVWSQYENPEEESPPDEEVIEEIEGGVENLESTLSPEDVVTSESVPTQDGDTNLDLLPEDKTEDLGSGVENTEGSTDEPIPADSTSPPVNEAIPNITIILIPVALVVFVAVVLSFALFLRRRFKMEAAVAEARKEDPYLDGYSDEKVPMPMFEEDVPSVLELEMEELDQWMIKDHVTTTTPT
ncbi:transmembrane protein 154 [Stigmatopora nigra]